MIKFKVVKGVRKSTFAPFEATNLEVASSKTGKTGYRFLSCLGADRKGHYVGLEELSALQEDRDDLIILESAAGVKAVLNEEASLAADVMIGRNEEGLLYAV